MERLELRLKRKSIALALGGFLICSLLGGLLLPGVGYVAELRDPGYFFDRNSGNLEREAATARSEGKQGILIMFDQANCRPCTTAMTTVLNQATTQDFYRRYFRILRVDTKSAAEYSDFVGKPTTAKDFAAKYRIETTPSFMFFDVNGNQRLRYTGITSSAGEFIWLGEFVVQGVYKNKTFSTYKFEKTQKK
jgi:thioredoxin-related protein